jgi:hypothetical protein
MRYLFSLFLLFLISCAPVKIEKVNWIDVYYQDFPGVVSIIHDSDIYGKYHKCTGSLIKPDLVLTAAHCLNDKDLLPEDLIIGYNCNDVSSPMSCYLTRVSSFVSQRETDIGLIFLDFEINAPVSELGEETPQEGQLIFVIGYGTRGILKGGATQVIAAEGNFFASSYESWMRPEPGDSGGPAYTISNRRVEIVGITASRETRCLVGECFSFIKYIDVVKQRQWIEDAYRISGPQPGN